jgi:ribosomal-protein-alanine acetyltransferase
MSRNPAKQTSAQASEKASRQPLTQTAIVRKYLPSDSEKVFEICKAAREAAQWPKDSYDRAESSGQAVYVAEVDGRLCGFLVARYAGGEAEILNMAVELSQRHRGIGTVLLNTASREAERKGIGEIFLEVRESNRAAIAFYEARGFFSVGKRTGYYREPDENAIVMRKKVTG